jgi:oxygen-independent coproporphyrinogen-3 oxidase
VNGVHMQNLDTWEAYRDAIDRGELPLGRAYRPSADERLIRETILQLKRGAIRPSYFEEKFGVDVRQRFAPVWRALADDGFLAPAAADRIALTRAGLLRVDMLLHRFFLPQHRNVRYT